MLRLAGLLAALATLAVPLAAQQAEQATFVVRHGADTVVVERTTRNEAKLTGELVIRGRFPRVEQWSAVVAPDGTMPMIEVTEKEAAEGETAADARVTRRSRILFKGDSAAVDDMSNRGLMTRLFGTRDGAVPYLNLSFGLLEPAVRRALAGGKAQGEIPFFNLGGGQTLVAVVRRTGTDGVEIALGSVAMQLTVDAEGRILTGAIPAQDVRVERR